jgi:hypothetical protein
MGANVTPLINGQTYGWGDIIVNINGLPITGITAIKYEEEQDKENIYGAGRYPVARGKGRIKSMASMTLMIETVMAIAKAAPNGQLHNLPPFPITVIYQPEAGPVVRDVIMNCEFKKQTRDFKEGDMKKEIAIELLVSHIVWDK